jgi:hypothetical protein
MACQTEGKGTKKNRISSLDDKKDAEKSEIICKIRKKTSLSGQLPYVFSRVKLC